MKTIRRALLCLFVLCLVLSTSGCQWLVQDAPALWPTKRLSGLDSRGQDLNFLGESRPTEAGLGGW